MCVLYTHIVPLDISRFNPKAKTLGTGPPQDVHQTCVFNMTSDSSHKQTYLLEHLFKSTNF